MGRRHNGHPKDSVRKSCAHCKRTTHGHYLCDECSQDRLENFDAEDPTFTPDENLSIGALLW